jgi:putative hydrolase of the HAD superfamily
MGIDAVIFDWGGTLSIYADVEVADMWTLAAGHLAAATGADPAAIQDRLVAAELRYWRRCDETWESGSLAGILSDASADLGIDVAEALLEEVATRHLDTWTPHIRHHDDAAPALESLRAAGMAIGLLSNTHWPRRFHEHFLERDGLDRLIDVRAYTSELPRSKPDPSVFRHVLDQLGVAPERAVMVGDRPRDDIWGAQQVGMKAVWRPHRMSPALDGVTPDAVIERLAEVPDLVSGW